MSEKEAEQKRQDFHSLARRLCGQKIVEVYYVAIDYEDGIPYWDVRDAHAPEFGLNLTLESGQTLGITWGWEFYQYALTFSETLLQGVIISPSVWNVSDKSQWTTLLHQRIDEVIIYWYEWNEKKRKESAPRDMEILFETGARVYIASAEYDFEKDPPQILCEDNITVIFEDEVAKRCQLGRFRGERYKTFGLIVSVRAERLCA